MSINGKIRFLGEFAPGIRMSLFMVIYVTSQP